ncbi:MAG: hypothetical protein KTR15_10620 [Phycisphaeraceae bacterium]|nr:hypothetical protein [Phycisphaeraceae bacterium]
MTPQTSNQSSSDEATEVFALLQQQRDLYRELKSHSEQQDALIANGETDQLLSLLAQRQRLIDGLGQVSSTLAPYRSRIAAIADQASGDLGKQMRGMIEEVRVLLESIIAADEKGKADLEAARDKVGGQIRQAAGAVAAAGAYGNAAPAGGPKFTEQRG